MNNIERIILILGAVAVLVYMLLKIRNKRIQIHYAIYWTFFSVAIVTFCAFPQIINVISGLLGVEVPVHLLFTVAAAMVVIKLFNDTIKMSELEKKIETLTQEIALLEAERVCNEKEVKE